MKYTGGPVLLHALLTILQGWRPAFSQRRSAHRAITQTLGSLLALGRRTLSRSLWALGNQQHDWSADYKLHSRADWNPDHLFQPIFEHGLPLCPGSFIPIAMDDTRIRKTGRKILSAFFQRDPLSPKFRFNLMWGLRFLHMSLLLPLYRSFENAPPRSIPIRFQEVPALKRPGKKATEQQREAYRQAIKLYNLSTNTVAMLESVRASLDQAGMSQRPLLAVGDNSFCNQTVLRANLPRTEILVRARKDIRLCQRAPLGSRSFYATEKFTPQQVLHNESIPWQQANIFHGGQWRQVRFKEVSQIYWQTGSGKRVLRLLVVAPIPYSSGKEKRKYYRDPAFLLTTDTHTAAELLLQSYFDRWQIEVTHRELKDTLGVGQAQLRSKRSVPRQPAMIVAAYSALLLAGIKVFGPHRSAHFPALPKWRRNAKRPSCLDLITVLRSEITQPNTSGKPLEIDIDCEKLVRAAAA